MKWAGRLHERGFRHHTFKKRGREGGLRTCRSIGELTPFDKGKRHVEGGDTGCCGNLPCA